MTWDSGTTSTTFSIVAELTTQRIEVTIPLQNHDHRVLSGSNS